jgi:enterochelin esterase family protein
MKESGMTQRRLLPKDIVLGGLLAGVLVASAFVPGMSVSAAAPAIGQPPAPAQGRGAAPGPVVVSPDVKSDRRVTFRVLAPEARKVELRSPGDIPGVGGRGVAPPQLTKNNEGIWEGTFGPVPAGAYRYVFTVDDVPVVDSRNPMTSQTNTTVYSLAVVPGSDVFDTKNVPHGAVAAVRRFLYDREALRFDRPGCELSRACQ